MKTCKLLLLVCVVSVCVPAAAQTTRGLKYVPQAVKGAKAVPYVVKPNLSPVLRTNLAVPVVRPQAVATARPNIATAVERQVVAKVSSKPQISKTSQKWLNVIEPWVIEHGRWPSSLIEEEKAMCIGADNAMYRHPGDPAGVRLKELKEKYGRNTKTSQEWLDIIEPWVIEHGRWPSQLIEEEKAMYVGAANAVRSHPKDPASVRLKELKEEYVKPYKTPQEWLDIVEPWVLENGRWPSSLIEEEKAMYLGAAGVMRRSPENPASVRLKELKEKYIKTKTPQGIYNYVTQFMREHNGKLPSEYSKDAVERSYRIALNVFHRQYKYLSKEELEGLDEVSRTLEKLYRQVRTKIPAEEIEFKKVLLQDAAWKVQPEEIIDPAENAEKAAALGEQQLSVPGTVTTDEYVNQLLRFYNKLDPLGTGTIQ